MNDARRAFVTGVLSLARAGDVSGRRSIGSRGRQSVGRRRPKQAVLGRAEVAICSDMNCRRGSVSRRQSHWANLPESYVIAQEIAKDLQALDHVEEILGELEGET
jgi:hypothetical protein